MSEHPSWKEPSNVTSTIILTPPEPAGGYRMGEVLFMLEEKPTWWHRMWVRVTLGWTWEDHESCITDTGKGGR